jgi:copper transport protein
MIRKAGRRLAVAVIVMLASFQAAAETPLAIHIHSERAMFQVLVAPGTVGTDSFVLQLMSGEGALLPVKQATLVLTLPGRGIEPLARKATLGADGYWHVEDVVLPFAGRWHMRIEAQTAFQNITLEDDFDVPAK